MGGLILVMSKGLPGSMPMSLSFLKADSSSALGGLSFITIASLLKKVPASMAATCSSGVLEVSTDLSTGTSVGGV